MKHSLIKTLPFAALAAVALAACSDNDARSTDAMSDDGVVVTVNGITDSGKIYVALQDESVFGAAKATYGTAVDSTKARNGSVDVMISDIDAGNYAVAVFQDTNGNGKMDVGSNGVPTEPWALSNGAGTRGAPSFDDAMVRFTGMKDRVSITLN